MVLIRNSSSDDIRGRRCCFFGCYVSFLTFDSLVGWNPGDDYVFVNVMFCFTIYVFYWSNYAHGICKNDGRLNIVALYMMKSFENCTSFCCEDGCGFWKTEFFTHVSTDEGKSNSLVSFGCVGVYFSVIWVFIYCIVVGSYFYVLYYLFDL